MRSGQEVLMQTSWTEPEVIALLAIHTYDEVSRLTGKSRGAIYNIACRFGARKHEERIRERKEQLAARQAEFLREALAKTVKMDVHDYLASLPDESVAAVITSPPYNMGKPYGQDEAGDATGGANSIDIMRPVRYEGWMTITLDEIARVLRPGATLCLQIGSTRDYQGHLVPMDVMFYDTCRRTGLTPQSRIVWEVPHGLTPRKRLAERYEVVLVFSKGAQATFNPNAIRVPQKEPGKRAFKGPNKGELSGHPLGAWPANVWRIPQVGHNHPEKVGHPCQFPQALARRLMLAYTMAGDLVCDPFSGSGTVQAEAIRCGRAFTGCDLFYDGIRTTRIARVLPDNYTELPGVTDASVAVWEKTARRVDVGARSISLTEERQLIDDLFSEDAIVERRKQA